MLSVQGLSVTPALNDEPTEEVHTEELQRGSLAKVWNPIFPFEQICQSIQLNSVQQNKIKHAPFSLFVFREFHLTQQQEGKSNSCCDHILQRANLGCCMYSLNPQQHDAVCLWEKNKQTKLNDAPT